MGQYHRAMKGSKMSVDDKCGRCYFWQRLDKIDSSIGICQYCNQTRREGSQACRKWLGKAVG